eukprot:gb/GECH01004325.1/.p1 GENE.gb/GECH01004325.1/~~gb/GECH01004325.1/.p1  ORF type:complete len:112 (+),score=19.16 gb/GECH01004325.1/:1-336(+)
MSETEFDREPKYTRAATSYLLRGFEGDQPDPRFPNTNQARRCMHAFTEYKQCSEALGEDSPRCTVWYKTYLNVCPSSWVNRFQDKIDDDVFVPYARSLPIPPIPDFDEDEE